MGPCLSIQWDELSPEIKLDQKPTCELKEQWRTTEIDGQELVRYVGADGCLYEKRSDAWFRIGLNRWR